MAPHRPDPDPARLTPRQPRTPTKDPIHVNAATGFWNLTIKTPLGTQLIDLHLWEDAGTLAGTASGTHETVPLVDPTLDGDRLTWAQAITRPLRLNLDFDLVIDGDTLNGTSKAGRQPRSTVTGTRRQT